MAKLTASWDISLKTECPICEHYFDLLDTDDFWHGIQPIEHGTPGTMDYEVECPKCETEFKVDFEY